MPHRFGGSPNCRYRIFQLQLCTGELLAPIPKFILFVGIDSIISARSSLGFDIKHGFSPCQRVGIIPATIET